MVKEVYAYLQTHWDREWYKTFEEYRLRLTDVMQDIFFKLENNEINCFYLDGQTVALDDYLEIFPEKRNYIKDLIKNKKLYIGPFYALADEFLVNGESLARNLLIGIKEAQKLDCEEFVGYLPDAFGHCAYMPMLLKKAGIKNAIVWRGVGEQQQEFLWESPDGSQIKTAYLSAGYFQDFFAHKSYKKNVNELLTNLSKNALNIPILLPIGADHLACEDKIKAKIKNFNRDNKNFRIKLSSLEKYFKATESKKKLPTVKGELRDNINSFILPSVFSSVIPLKQHNMYSQWLLGKISEPLFAITNGNKQNVFDYAWKLLVQNHAHDSICGCSLDEVHKENITRFEKIEQLCNSAIELAKYKLNQKVSSKELLLINLSNYNFKGVYSFYSDKKLPLPIVSKKKAFPNEISMDIHNIPVQENYRTYYEYLAYAENIEGLSIQSITPKNMKKSDLKITKSSLENSILQVKINNDGTLNIKNKITGLEFKNLHKITDEADIGDSYNFSPIIDDKKLTAEYIGSKIIENNSLRCALLLQYKLKIPSHAKNEKERSSKKLTHKFNVKLSLTANSSRLDFKINYENLSKDHILRLNFNLPEIITETVSEDTFGTIKRKYNPEYNYKNLLPAPKGAEIDLNTNATQRFVISQGLCILTKGLQEYEVSGKELNISLLRCFGIISKKKLLTRNAPAGPPLPTPKAQCIGPQSAEYAIILTDNPQDAIKEADMFYQPLIASRGTAKSTTLNSSQYLNLPENFYLYSLKESENRNYLTAKIFNLSDKPQNLKITGKKEIFETNILEENLSNKNLSKTIINFSPKELKILKIK